LMFSMSTFIKSRGQLLKESLLKISPLIEQYTWAVCPDCLKVCCANKHGIPEKEDILFFESIGYKWKTEILNKAVEGPPDAPCVSLGEKGCTRERWQRPFRCTWYFCPALLEYMGQSRAREYRHLVEELDRLVAIRRDFLGSLNGKQ
jgi:hypothetical protein